MFLSDEFVFDDHIYGFTYGANVSGMVYNKKAFKQAGITEIPKTITALFQTMAKLKKKRIFRIHGMGLNRKYPMAGKPYQRQLVIGCGIGMEVPWLEYAHHLWSLAIGSSGNL